MKRGLIDLICIGAICFNISSYAQEEINESSKSSYELAALENLDPAVNENVYTVVVEDIVKAKNREELKKEISLANTVNFISLYEGNWNYYSSNLGFFELYARNLKKELDEDPFYYLGEKYEEDKIYYDGQMLSALGETLVQKYNIFRIAEQCVKQIQEKTTLEYKADDGLSVKIRPLIENLDEEDHFKIKVKMNGLPFNLNLVSILGQEETKLSITKPLPEITPYSRLYFDLIKNRDEETKEKNLEFVIGLKIYYF